MTTGQNIVLFAILILGLIFLFRRYCLKKLYGFRLLFIIYISILLCCSFLSYFIRLYLLSRLGINFFYPFLTMVGALPLPVPAPSDPSSSSSWMDGGFIRESGSPDPGDETSGLFSFSTSAFCAPGLGRKGLLQSRRSLARLI